MTKILHGTIRGRTIELTEDAGLAEGQEVEVSKRTFPDLTTWQPGEGLLRTEGALADDPHWDAIMEEVYRERKTIPSGNASKVTSSQAYTWTICWFPAF
jgi:hypothetical protein